MGKIHLLSSDTINRIAAGEVIERPASIVKELVENSLDSGATAITVDIQNGGISFIRITDNGSGFERDDIPVAFLRHATSKISEESDLLRIVSLGFRGEALSSIASVSKVELLTKRSEDFLGNRYVIEGGEERSFEDVGCPNGTTFLIRDLFYNVPARRKFLKSATTEAGYINELVNRFAVARSDVSFTLNIQGRTVLHTSGNGNRKDAVYAVFGREIAENLIPVSYEGERLSITGFLGKSVITRGNRNYENFFVNGRYVRSSLIYKAIEDAYQPYMMQHKYPFTVLLFTMKPSEIDVNIHPTKMDVRFSEQDALYQEITSVLSDFLHRSVLIPDIALVDRTEKKEAIHVPESFETNRILMEREKERREQASVMPKPEQLSLFREEKPEYASARPESGEVAKSVSSFLPTEEELFGESTSKKEHTAPIFSEPEKRSLKANEVTPSTNFEASVENVTTVSTVAENTSVPKNLSASAERMPSENITPTETFVPITKRRAFQIIGQIFRTYWIVETEGEMYIIDQHAAHEKIIYERMVRNMSEGESYSQAILPSIVVSLSIREEELLRRHLETFTKSGFEIEHFGGRDYQISAVPTALYRMDAKDYFLSILDSLDECTGTMTPERVYETIASMSCKAAIKGNHRMSEEEARGLIEELMTLENPFHCPHGRPIIVSMTMYELEKKFKRIV